MVSVSNFILIALQAYFLLMNFTVERFYCLSDLGGADDKRFLVPETVAFCKQNNPLFIAKVRSRARSQCLISLATRFRGVLRRFQP